MKRHLIFVLVILSMVTSLLAACVAPTPVQVEVEKTVEVEVEKIVEVEVTPQASMYQEAPMLTEIVEAGELPPVEERLPENPLVIEPLNEIGKYGGTFRRGTAWLGGYLTENFTREPLAIWQRPLVGVGPPVPNLAEEWEYSDDGTEVTAHIRKGIKWSDGEPFTTADIEFYWYDVMLNEDCVCRSIPSYVTVGGEPPTLEVIDDYTLKFIYPDPYYMWAESMATMSEIAWPKHFLSEYHPKYNDDATYEEFCENWAELHDGRAAVTLQAWMLEEFVPGEVYSLVRNPYYWKVDTAGNQLPYFDRARVEIVEDRQAVALGNVTGKFDQDSMWVGIQHLELFMDNILERDYDVGYTDLPGMGMFFNMDIEDPVKRAAFRDADFRRAFSMAIKREELSELFYSGQLTPGGTAFSANTPYYREEYTQRWIEGDPEAARALLEEAGYLDVDGDGFVESPDGEPLEIIINVAIHDLYTPSVETIVEHLAEAGINTIMNAKQQDEIGDLADEGNFEIHVWDADTLDAPLSPAALNLVEADPGPLWHLQWRETGAFCEHWEEAVDIILNAATMPYEERVEALTQVNDWMSDEVWFVHTGYYHRPFIVSNRIGNAARRYTRNATLTDMPPHAPFQYYEKYPPQQ